LIGQTDIFSVNAGLYDLASFVSGALIASGLDIVVFVWLVDLGTASLGESASYFLEPILNPLGK
jgi:hypothetical protein